ncbi:MAG: glutamate--tRNA ligase [Pegethrix bostrychoides GSE-TBD4-15B]|jgi:glutamyl-tRNA synthetase|uniref:Glutamate--tRNA ligase n=1 Tax=Pegethrix bostrychoides GSE-TBD4-15B TaxID=2839662 RepID=A0A951PDY7_9CYAN|nr:glutamate--tRNA ligase [Pegethrix bostrychoides GSE-TBD4-15B]
MSVRVRIAPSPTGKLHIGTARTAVFNWLFAQHHGGTFVLRIEDTDLERSKPEYTENIMQGLRWLGMSWDEGPSYQTERLALYQQQVQKLLDQGLAYRAYDTPAELDAMREDQKAQNQAPRYDNRHRHLTPEQEAAFQAEGRQPVVRFKIDDDREIVWNDMVRDAVTWKGRDLGGDMVIARAAAADQIGPPLYNFVVVVDDIDMQISHVIRGEDHIGNTPKQILLYEALGASLPQFGHTPLILNQAGAKLSKRDGVTSISEFQAMGYTAAGLVNYMTLLGWSPPESLGEIFTLDAAAAQFDFERVNRAGAKFDWDKLNWINSQYLHHMPPAQLTDLLLPYWQEAGYPVESLERSWLEQVSALIATDLVRLDEAATKTRYLFVSDVGFSEAATAQLQLEKVGTALQAVAEALEQQPLSAETVQSVIQAGVDGAKVKKGLVMKSLRAALTGDLQGPDLVQSWLLLNQQQMDLPRLKQALTLAVS